MSGAAEQVAALEGEAAQAASSAQAAQAAADAAAQAAAILTMQATANAAEEIREAQNTVKEVEGETEWLKTQVTELRASMIAMQETQTTILSSLAELRETMRPATPSPSPTPPEGPSDVAPADPDSATRKNNDAPPSDPAAEQKPAKQKRHRFL